MSKKFISMILIFVLLIAFIDAFSASYTSHNISNLAYVLALGIDVGEKAEMKISAQFSKSGIFSSSGGGSSDESSSMVLVSAEADSIFSGINLLNSYIGKEINLAHCNVIIFSEEICQKGISRHVYTLMNNEEIRPSIDIVVSKCTASEYLSNVKPSLEKLTTQYYDTFTVISKFTGYISNITLGEFFYHISSDTCNATAILGGLNATAREESEKSEKESSSSESSSSGSGSSESSGGGKSSSNSSSLQEESKLPENVSTNPDELKAGESSIQGKSGTENIGLAVFDDDKMCGELTAMEAVCYALIKNNIDTCIISIDSPFESPKKVELNISPSKKTKTNVDFKDEIPYISVELFLDADILTLDNNIDYESNESLEKFSESTKNYLKSEISEYLKKISKEYGVDIHGFCNKGSAHFSTIPEWEEYNWREKFKNAEFDVSVNVDVISSLLLTKT